MTPEAGPPSAGPMSTRFFSPPTNPPQQSTWGGHGPASRGYQPYGYGAPAMVPQAYCQMPNSASIPGSAGGYGRPEQMQSSYGGPPSAGGYPPLRYPSFRQPRSAPKLSCDLSLQL